MLKLLAVLLVLLNISALHGKETEIKVLLLNNTWLKADLLKSDREANLTIRVDKREYILRRKEFRLVKMASPLPEMLKAGELLKLNKRLEAGKLLASAAAKYNFPLVLLKIRILQARIKIADADYQAAVSLLNPLLEAKMTMPQFETDSCAYGFLLLGNAYVKLKQQDNAGKAYQRSFELAVPEYSAMAKLNLGRMLLKQKRTQGALDCFLENISVFAPEVPGRKLSLQETIAVYKKNKDKKLKVYEDMFKKEYSIKAK